MKCHNMEHLPEISTDPDEMPHLGLYFLQAKSILEKKYSYTCIILGNYNL